MATLVSAPVTALAAASRFPSAVPNDRRIARRCTDLRVFDGGKICEKIRGDGAVWHAGSGRSKVVGKKQQFNSETESSTMPFTFAHPAAVLPLRSLRCLPIVFSALVIGSMAPDIVYFAPLSLDGDFTHSIAGLFLFCMPAGFLLHFLIVRGLRRPLTALLPFEIARRLATRTVSRGLMSRREALPILLSLLIGAVTHVLWDAMTHVDTVVTLPGDTWHWLAGHSFGQFSVYPVAQHVSSIAGIALLCNAMRGWMQSTPPQPAYVEQLRPAVRWLTWGAIIVVATFAALLAWGDAAAEPLSLRYFHCVVASIRWLVVSALAWCAMWHLGTVRFLHADADRYQ